MERISKALYYAGIAKAVSQRSSCLNKHWGAVIVKNDVIVATGYNGAPRKVQDCVEKGYCRLAEYRQKHKLGRGEGYEHCLSVHAEMNAIISASKEELEGSTLYLYGVEKNLDGAWFYVLNPMPCTNCRKAIINAKIKTVMVQINDDRVMQFDVDDWKIEDCVTGGY